MSMKRLSTKRCAARRRHAFTLIEILVVVAIIALLVAILIPSLRRARDQALNVVCGSNLGQVGKALHMYAHDSKGHLPVLYRTPSAFTTYYMFRPDSGRVNLGLLARKRFASDPEVFYCPTQNREDSAGIAYDSPDNPWAGFTLEPPKPVRSSYLARLIEVPVENVQIGSTKTMEPMPPGKKTDWKIADYNQKAIYSDFTGTNGYQGGGIVVGHIWMPHRRRGFNKLYGDTAVLWGKPGLLEEYRPIDATAPTAEEMVEYWKLLDRGR